MVGQVAAGQWTIRAFGPSESAKMSPAGAHPWQSHWPADAREEGLSLVAPRVGVIGNSSFPYGFNDGPVWAGKGLTAFGTGGARAAYGPLSIVVNPIAFVAQNADFRIADNGLTGDRQFADWSRPGSIDRPQRFGSSAYARVDPGESELRVEGFGLAAGLSSRGEMWGPAFEHPLILGTNAGGIPRLFAGTRAPLELGWLRAHGRVLWGRLQESRYGADTGAARRHFATGVAGTIGIRGAPGVELGGSRFFHTSWPPGGYRDLPWLRVVQAFIKNDPGTSFGLNPDNQLASAFIRVAPPGRGFEVYGEFGREDRNATFRDLLLEPDHIAAYTIGLARAWARPDASRITVIRGETLNSRISHLVQQRPQSPWYEHGAQRQGHTYRGQVLGSEGGFGGGASVVAVDRYTPAGRTTVRWDRINRSTPLNSQGLPVPDRVDMVHAIGLEVMRFTGRGELTIGGILAKEFNRYFADDALNAQLRAEYRIVR
jgi:hypothetical protein